MGKPARARFDAFLAPKAEARPKSPPDESVVPSKPEPADGARVRDLVSAHFDFIWRSLRRLGIPESATDDATQKVFLVASRKMGRIPVDAERSYLFSIALRVAAEERRAYRRRPDRGVTSEVLPEIADDRPPAEELLDAHRARAILDEIVRQMPLEFSAVFVLAELEEMTAPAIAALLRLPLGTVASRLRRGRELFDRAVVRCQAGLRRRGLP